MRWGHCVWTRVEGNTEPSHPSSQTPDRSGRLVLLPTAGVSRVNGLTSKHEETTPVEWYSCYTFPCMCPRTEASFAFLFSCLTSNISPPPYTVLRALSDSSTSKMDIYARPTMPLSMVPVGDPYFPTFDHMTKSSDSQAAQPQLPIKRRAPIACRR